MNEPPEAWIHGWAHLDDSTLHYVETGEPDNPLVVFLHGFPEFRCAWRHQLGPLADAGFHVLAPDRRGYNRSEKPPHVSEYRMHRLVNDIAGLIRDGGAASATSSVTTGAASRGNSPCAARPSSNGSS